MTLKVFTLSTWERFVGQLLNAINDEKLIKTATSAVSEEMILCPRSKVVYSKLLSGERDIVELAKRSAHAGCFKDQSEAVVFLSHCFEYAIPGTAHTVQAAKAVVNEWKHHQAQKVAQRLAEGLSGDMDSVLNAAEESIKKLRGISSSPDHTPLADVTAGIAEKMEDGEGLADRFPTFSLGAIDQAIGGLRPGANTVVGALTSVGKSLFCQRAALWFARDGFRTVIYSCEMSRESVVERLMCMAAGMSHEQLQAAPRNEDKTKLLEAMNEVGNLPIEVVHCPGWTVEQIEADAYKQASDGVPAVVIVDYVQLLKTRRPIDSREQMVSECAQKIRDLGGELGCHTIVAAQLNSQAEGVEPQLHHIRDSKAVGMHADVVLLLEREEFEDHTEGMMVHVRKNRNGRKCSYRYEYKPEKYQILDPNHHEEFDEWAP